VALSLSDDPTAAIGAFISVNVFCEIELGSAALAFDRPPDLLRRLTAQQIDRVLIVELGDLVPAWLDPALMTAMAAMDLIRAGKIAQHGAACRTRKPGLDRCLGLSHRHGDVAPLEADDRSS
jgi:hypothetical protein